ncbi:MAG TPA: hypothetical protein VN368_02805 [Candidatus Methylomirabilis sp.]|nr:hypothetical protein [Candidatus Methylomirabilis sp.]
MDNENEMSIGDTKKRFGVCWKTITRFINSGKLKVVRKEKNFKILDVSFLIQRENDIKTGKYLIRGRGRVKKPKNAHPATQQIKNSEIHINPGYNILINNQNKFNPCTGCLKIEHQCNPESCWNLNKWLVDAL